MSSNRGAIEQLKRYLTDPVAYVREVIRAEPTPQQTEVLEALVDDQPIAARSGHGVGKTSIEAWAVLWFLPLHPMARVPCTAPTGHQLDDLLWPEIRKWMDRSPFLSGALEWTKTRLSVKGYEDTWFAVPQTANKPESLQGFHGDHLMFVVEEASGVEQEIMEVVEGALTNDGARLLMFGNPTRLSGTFYDAFHRSRESYRLFTFSSEDSPLVSPAYCERIAKRYGRDSDVYLVRVRGLFPKGEPDTYIRLEDVEAAMSRSVDAAGRWFLGVDPARFGDDESVICSRHGLHVEPYDTFHGIDTTELTGRVVRRIRDIRKVGYQERIEVRVDDTGVGGGVTDQLRREARDHTELNFSVEAVNFGGEGDDDFADLGSRIWGDVQEQLPHLELPADDVMASELSTRKYRIDPDGRIKLERKEDMKKRGLASPDRGDALALSLMSSRIGRMTKTAPRSKPATAGMRGRKF